MVSWSRSPLSSTLVLVTFVIWRPRARADTPVSECVSEGGSVYVQTFHSMCGSMYVYVDFFFLLSYLLTHLLLI
jgi:hypothetical protein